MQRFVYDDWTLDTPENAYAFGQGPAGFARPASQGWNVVLVLDGLDSNAVKQKYTWGLDLSGTVHGAGGVGGLLASEEPQSQGDPKRYWFLYDGNGNVIQVLDATDTEDITVAAKYEYDPYGHQLASTGPYAAANPFRFSTKWSDAEVDYPNTTNDGLYYYGRRYYLPRLGRWINRDPIEEKGGLNLFVFAMNAPSFKLDYLGQVCFGFGISGSGTLMLPVLGYAGFGLSGSVSTQFFGCTTKPHCRVCDSVSLSFVGGMGVNVAVGGGFIVTVGGDPSDGLSFSVGGSLGGPIASPANLEVVLDINITDKNVSITIPRVTAGITCAALVRITGSCTGCTAFWTGGGVAARWQKINACLTGVNQAPESVTAAYAEWAETPCFSD